MIRQFAEKSLSPAVKRQRGFLFYALTLFIQSDTNTKLCQIFLSHHALQQASAACL